MSAQICDIIAVFSILSGILCEIMMDVFRYNKKAVKSFFIGLVFSLVVLAGVFGYMFYCFLSPA